MLEVAHEALFRGWQRLVKWLDQDLAFLLWRKRVDQALEFWVLGGKRRQSLLVNDLLHESQSQLRRFLKKNFPQLGSRSRADQNVPLGQLRVALQASFNRLHRFLAQGYPLLIHLAA